MQTTPSSASSSRSGSSKIGGEFGEIRAVIDIDSLNLYIADHIPQIKTPVAVKQFKGGQSNPTYLLIDAKSGSHKSSYNFVLTIENRGSRWVLRKKPAGKLVSNAAHQIEREYTILEAIHWHNVRTTTPAEKKVPVPEPFAFCEDLTVIGTPFYLMEFLDGRIFTDPKMAQIPAADRKECWLSAIQALAALSSLDPAEVGLSHLGPHTPYFPRQVKALGRISRAQAEITDARSGKPVGQLPMFEEVMEWFGSHLPDERKTGLRIVHGDYKIENLVFHPTENRIIGILDWELCTLGSPLADLACLTQPWCIDPEFIPKEVRWGALDGLKNTKDKPIELDVLEREYCKLTKMSYPVPDINYARSWMLMRLAVNSQGIAARYAQRQATSGTDHVYVRAAVNFFPIMGQIALRSIEEAGGRLASKAKL
ncbi:APH-domain-containing protein [Gloeophyllum trabeum ATCC 11539]|uniref:APH-domain-containing protein n=1 Tax=Gloeophyllum trabeum (strain ATCC 11539 / FP-39264 / Madison 617) TaxID=670483 RepID=S7RLC5_GLOTA|nr:APH-domain-containing protein [Gloeophyllum trabeum ATCC 11539]EPQ55195.1 APH-domain-containing protein [Gloeophyllum trabeum ATCC 11539]